MDGGVAEAVGDDLAVVGKIVLEDDLVVLRIGLGDEKNQRGQENGD